MNKYQPYQWFILFSIFLEVQISLSGQSLVLHPEPTAKTQQDINPKIIGYKTVSGYILDAITEMPIQAAEIVIYHRIVDLLPNGENSLREMTERYDFNCRGITDHSGFYQIDVPVIDGENILFVIVSEEQFEEKFNSFVQLKRQDRVDFQLFNVNADESIRNKFDEKEILKNSNAKQIDPPQIEADKSFNQKGESKGGEEFSFCSYPVNNTIYVKNLKEEFNSYSCPSSGNYTGYMPMDEFIAGVVAGEMGAGTSFPTEAKKAQAVAARTYAIWRENYPSTGGNCGMAFSSSSCSSCVSAANNTTQQVITKNNNIIQALFSARCNGNQTRSSAETGCNSNGNAFSYLVCAPCSGHLPCQPGETCCNYSGSCNGSSGIVYGHGVGLCQRGCQGFANQGKDYLTILTGYYAGVCIANSGGSGSACTNWSVNPSNQSVPASGGTFSAQVFASGGCSFSIPSGNYPSWITITLPLTSPFQYTVQPNTGSSRSGIIWIKDATNNVNQVTSITINQSGAGCQPPSAPTLSQPGLTSCSGQVFNSNEQITFSWSGVQGAVGYDFNVSKYPYGSSCNGGSSNNVFISPCFPNTSGYVAANTFQPGMLYRWNVQAYAECNNGNCKTLSTNTLYFQIRPDIFTTSPTTICSEESVIIQTNQVNINPPGAATYVWYKNGNQVGSGTSTSFTATQSGTYTMRVLYSGSSCCLNGETVESNGISVYVSPPVNSTITGETTGCIGNSIQLCVSQPYIQYLWSNGGNAQCVDVNAGGTYVVTVTNANGCTGSTSQVINFTNPPTPSVGITASQTVICAGQTVNFTATPTNGGTSPVYQWYVNSLPAGNSGSIFSSNALTNQASVNCTMVSNAICSNLTTVTSNPIAISVISPPQPNLTLSDGLVHASNISGIQYSYKWFFNSTFISSQPAVNCLQFGNGNYLLEVTYNGCSSSSGEVYINCLVDVSYNSEEVYLAVYPNPSNGEFGIEVFSPQLDQFHLAIYNGLGQVLYEQWEYAQSGKLKRQLDLSFLPSGIYYLQLVTEGRLLKTIKVVVQK